MHGRGHGQTNNHTTKQTNKQTSVVGGIVIRGISTRFWSRQVSVPVDFTFIVRTALVSDSFYSPTPVLFSRCSPLGVDIANFSVGQNHMGAKLDSAFTIYFMVILFLPQNMRAF